MDFSIHPNQTLVTSHLTIESSSATTSTMKDNWVLDGDGTSLKLTSIQLNGNTLLPNVDYAVTDHELIIFPHARENTMPLKNGTWKLTTVVEICPESNTQLSGTFLCNKK
jgi:aminopeptidase N